MAFADDGMAEARQLLQDEFAADLARLDQDPLRALQGDSIEKFTGDFVARVNPAGPDDSGLVESSVPLRDPSDEGGEEPADLSLEQEAGHFEAENPLVDVALPAEMADAVRLQDSGVGISLTTPEAAVAEGTMLQGQDLFYHEAAQSTDLILAPMTQGVELLAQIRSIEAPERLPFELDLPDGAALRDAGPRGLEIVRSNELLARVSAPVAIDAQGTSVESKLVVTGPKAFEILTPHRSASIAYPVLIDPLIEDWHNNSWQWHWNGNNAGWGVASASPSGYSAPWGTFGCQAGYNCWGHGLYLQVGGAWQIGNGNWTQWYYRPPGPPSGSTTYVNHAYLSTFNFSRNGENNWGTPYAYWGVYSNEYGWLASGSAGSNITGWGWAMNPTPAQSADQVIFGMGNNYHRVAGYKLTAPRTASLGAALVHFDDPEPPSIGEPVPSPGAPALTSWLPAGHGTSEYPSEVLADAPALHLRFGDPPGSSTATDASGHGVEGKYHTGPAALKSHAYVTDTDSQNKRGSVNLDGATEYIDSNYATRRNLVPNPSVEVGTAGYAAWGSPAGLSRDTSQAQHRSASLKVNAAPAGHGAWVGNPGGTFIAVTPGQYYSAAVQLKGGAPTGIDFYLLYTDSSFNWLRLDSVRVNASGGWTRAALNGSAIGAAPAGSAYAIPIAANADSATQSFSVDAAQLEANVSIGGYFDGSTPAASWEGAADASVSASSQGPFANGTTRTFEGWSSRDTLNTWDMLATGRSVDQSSPYLGAYANDVYWSPRGNADNPWSGASWAGAWPGAGQWVHWVLVFDEAANSAELFINGESKGARTVTGAYSNAPGELQAGAWAADGTRYHHFDGQLDELAVYDYALSPARIASHYAKAASGIGWVKATATDPGVGVQSFALTYPKDGGGEVVQTDPEFPACPGGTRSTTVCHELVTAEFPFNTYNATGGPLPEGISALTLTATDALGKSTPRTVDVRVDRSSPALAEPPSGGLFSPTQPGYDLHVSATDGTAVSLSAADRPNARSGVKRIDLYRDRSTNPAPIATTGNQTCTAQWGSCTRSWDYTLNPQNHPQGNRHFELVITDQLGQEKSVVWDAEIDHTPPNVTSPVAGSVTDGWLTGGTASLEVTAKNALSGVQKITAEIPNASGPPTIVEHPYNCTPHCPERPATASWDIPVGSLPEGESTITARAYGPNGDTGSVQTAEIKVDRTPALAGIGGPDGWLSEGTATVAVGGANPGPGVSEVTLDLPGGGVLSHAFDCSDSCPEEAYHGFEVEVDALPNGVAEAIGRAYGPGGVASAAAPHTLSVDHTAPDMMAGGAVFDAPGALVGASSTWTLDVDDEGSGVNEVALSVDGAEMDVRNVEDFGPGAQDCDQGSCSFHAEDVIDWFDTTGVHTVGLTVTDAAGHTDSFTNQVDIDSTTPSLSVTGDLADLDGQPMPGESAVATISAEDADADDAGIARIDVYVGSQLKESFPSVCDSGCPESTEASFEYAKADWGPGPHEVKFEVIDAAGNTEAAMLLADEPPSDATPPPCPSEDPEVLASAATVSAAEAANEIAAQADSPLAPTVPSTDAETGVLLDPVLVAPDPESAPEPNLPVVRSVVDAAASTDATAGLTLGSVACLAPASTTEAATDAHLVQGEEGATAAVYANTAPATDTVVRPTARGAALVLNLRGPAAPEVFRWNVGLNPGETLEELDDGGIAIVNTTEPDIPECDSPAPSEGEDSFAGLGDAALQDEMGRRDLCDADDEVTTGTVEAVIAPPVAIDEAGNPVPATLEYVQIPDVPPFIVVEIGPWPNPNKKSKLKLKASAKKKQQPWVFEQPVPVD